MRMRSSVIAAEPTGGASDRSGQPAQVARPNIHIYGACAVCRCVLVRIMAGTVVRCNTFHEGRGM